MVENENRLIKDFFNLKSLYIFLIFIEIVNFSYSYIVDTIFSSKIVMSACLFVLYIVYCSVSRKKQIKKDTFISITLVIYFIYLMIFVPIHLSVLSIGFYIIEIALLLIFSNYMLINKVFLNYLFVILIMVIELIDKQYVYGSYGDFIFLIAFSLFSLLGILISDSIISKFTELFTQKEKKSREIIAVNTFYKNILDSEGIKLFYFFPDQDKAILINNNFSEGANREVEHFFSFVRAKKIVSIDYFGIIQNAIKIVRDRGFCSIILPIAYNRPTPVWMKLVCTKIYDESIEQDKILVSVTDINELKTVELKFKNALKQCSISVWDYDIENDRITSYTDLILDYYFYGKPIENASEIFISRNMIYYDDVKTFSQAIEKVRAGDNEVICEIRAFPIRESAYTWVRINFTCFKNTLGVSTNAWVSVENIDDAKASEKWFEIERNKTLDNRTGLIAMSEMNVSRNIVKNCNVAEQYKTLNLRKGPSIKDMVDSFLKIGVIVEGKEVISKRFTPEYLLENYEMGRRVLEFEYEIITKNNSVLYISNILKLFLDLKTKEIIAFSFLYDITQRKILNLSIEAIYNTKFVYLAYVNILNSQMSILQTQLIDVTNKANPNRIYKLEWEAYADKYVHPDDREYLLSKVSIENVRKEIKYKNSFSFTYRISDHGNMVTYRRCHFVKTEKDSPFILIMEENVTHEILTTIKDELVLKEALVQAKQAATAKDYFLSRMSHEIRTPLSAILGLSEIGINNEKIDTNDYFNKINEAGTYLLGLMNDILDMNKIEMGQIEINPEPIDTEKFYKMIITIIKTQASNKNINFIFNHKGKYYRYQILEKLRLHQILLNVLNNAIKYTPVNGEVIYTVENIEEAGNLFSVHTIEDNGVGISNEFVEKVFQPFTREKNSLSDTEGGTGLGLAICANLVKQLNGNISLESKLGKGTKVTIKLPLIAISEEQYIEKNKNKKPIPKKNIFVNKKILIAEDHKVNAMIIQTILNNLGIETVLAENGKQAVEIFSNSTEKEFDMILMDIMMPELNGLEATKQIRNLDRKDSKSIVIIALSANAFEKDRQKSIEKGFNSHLKKPIETDVLLETLNKYL